MTIPRVVGIDMSLTSTGLAGVEDTTGAVVGYATHLGASGHKGDSWSVRLARIDTAVTDILNAVHARAGRLDHIDLVCVEGPATSSTTGSVWDRAGLWHHFLWELRQRDVPVAVLAPTTRAKWATGRGNAGKAEVVEAMTRRYGHVWDSWHGSDDETDAAALCAAGLWHLGYPLVAVPLTHAGALDVVEWPMPGQGRLTMAAAP